MKYVRKEFKNDFILITCENVNNKWNEKNNGLRLYLKFMLNILKAMESFTFIYIPLGT
jgi:hypothetical protein